MPNTSSKHIENNVEQLDTKKTSKRRVIIFIAEVSLIILLLIIWFSSESIQKSHHLLVLFLYSFPSQFLIAIVPHEPVYFYFSKFYDPLIVTMVSVSGTILTEIINYSVFKFIVDLKNVKKLSHGSFVQKLINWFNKAPFLALWVAGFTPVPFYPFRFLVVLARYPLIKYILAVFLSRTPRFYIFALLGHTIKIPNSILLVTFIILVIIANIPIIKNLIQRKRSYSVN